VVADEGLQIRERHLRRVGRLPERDRWNQDEAILADAHTEGKPSAGDDVEACGRDDSSASPPSP